MMNENHTITIEEIVDGWRIIVDNNVVAKFNNELAFNLFSNIKKSQNILDTHSLLKVYTNDSLKKAEKYIGNNIPVERLDNWQISDDFFDFKNSNLLKDIKNKMDIWTSPQEVMLRAGEMYSDEKRTAMAVLNGFSRDLGRTFSNMNTQGNEKISLDDSLLKIDGFQSEYVSSGSTSLTYYPESSKNESMYVVLIDSFEDIPKNNSKMFEVGLYSPNRECLWYKQIDNKEEAIEEATTLSHYCDIFKYNTSDEPELTDDEIELKNNSDYAIQVNNEKSKIVFCVNYFNEGEGSLTEIGSFVNIHKSVTSLFDFKSQVDFDNKNFELPGNLTK
jgi:hypothetical protein